MAAVSTGMGHQGIVPAGGAGTRWRTGTRLPVGGLGRIHKKIVQGLSGAEGRREVFPVGGTGAAAFHGILHRFFQTGAAARDQHHQQGRHGHAQPDQVPDDGGAVRQYQISHENVRHRQGKAQGTAQGNIHAHGHEQEEKVTAVAHQAVMQAPAQALAPFAVDDDTGQHLAHDTGQQDAEQHMIDAQGRQDGGQGRAQGHLARPQFQQPVAVVVDGVQPVDVIHLFPPDGHKSRAGPPCRLPVPGGGPSPR